jgi:glycosyltransferase involved in cell wall biosynthesis
VKNAANKKDGRVQNVCAFGFVFYEFDARVRRYTKFLVQDGYHVDVLCATKGESQSRDNEVSSVCFFALGGMNQKIGKERGRGGYLLELTAFFLRAFFRLSFLHLKKRYTCVHVHNMPDWLVFAALVPKLFGAKIILDIHDRVPELYARRYGSGTSGFMVSALRLAERLSCRFADHVIIANDTWKKRLVSEHAVRDEDCTAIPNFPDSKLFPSRDQKSSMEWGTPCTLVYLGSFTEVHGLDVAIRAMALLRDKAQPFRLFLYGGGPYENEMRSLIESLKLSDMVEIKGSVPQNRASEVLKACDIGIVPKRGGVFAEDALSTKLFEYAAIGLPIIASRTRAELEYYDETEVLYFTPEDSNNMAERIMQLYNDPELRRSLVSNASRKTQKHRQEINKDQYKQVFSKLNLKLPKD